MKTRKPSSTTVKKDSQGRTVISSKPLKPWERVLQLQPSLDAQKETPVAPLSKSTIQRRIRKNLAR